MCIIILNTENT